MQEAGIQYKIRIWHWKTYSIPTEVLLIIFFIVFIITFGLKHRFVVSSDIHHRLNDFKVLEIQRQKITKKVALFSFLCKRF